MQLFFRILIVSLLSVFVLVGCRGDSPYEGDAVATPGDGDDDDDDGGATPLGISYLPLSVYEAYEDYSGFFSDSLFQPDSWLDASGINSLVISQMINPIDAATFETVSNAVVSDYKVTVDSLEIDATESFPILQKVIGVETTLTTALVFDLSSSVNAVDIEALVAEAKAYIARAQSHSDAAIRNQKFVVWAFAKDVQDVTLELALEAAADDSTVLTSFTSDVTMLNAALDRVVEYYESRELGDTSNLHRAIVESIGRFVDPDGEFSYRGRPYNDLEDSVRDEGVFLSHLVVFSSGPDTFLELSQSEMTRAIKSQSFLKYNVEATGADDEMVYLNKPVFYYVVGGATSGTAYTALSDLAETSTGLNLVGGAYEFESQLIANQISAISRRIDLDNQYLFRYAFIPRIGEHTSIFSSHATGYNFSFTTTFTEEYMAENESVIAPSELSSLLEITGPNGEFISGNDLVFSEAQTFAPATRWTNDVYGPEVYNWSIVSGSGVRNSNGTFTVTSVTGTATLTLTNSALTSGGGAVSIQITN